MALPSAFRLDPASRRLSLDPRDAAFQQDPYAVYARVLHEAPVAWWEQLGMWCVFAHADVDALLRDRRLARVPSSRTSGTADGPADVPAHTRDFDAVEACSLLESEPPEHTRRRALVARAFAPRRIEALRPVVAAMAHDLVDRFPTDAPFDLIGAYATPIPVRTIAHLLGVSAAMAPQLLDWSHRMVAMYGVARTRAVEVDANAAAADFAAWVRATIAERRARPGDDLLSRWVAAGAQGDRLSEAELVSTTILLLNAGHEATVHALGHAVHAVLAHPSAHPAPPAADAARPVGMRYAAAVEESLRFTPPLHLFKRWLLDDVEVRGVRLARDTQVGLVLGAAGRDPRHHPDPDHFTPAPAACAHASFGAGIHYCLGAPLARMELAVALDVLFTRCPGLRLVEPPRLRPTWHFYGLDRLVVRCR